MHNDGARAVWPIIKMARHREVHRIGLTGTWLQQLMLQGVSVGATDARKTGATGLRSVFAKAVGMWLQCRKTLRIQQYCPSQNWSYNARVLKA
jgi:hypothetical protein